MATHTVTPTPRVLFLGHSFIQRLQQFIEHYIGYFDLSLQITSPAHITWHGIGGRTVAKTIKFDLHLVRSSRPDIVIVQLFTNDLPFQSLLQVGSELEDIVRWLHDSYGVEFLCVCQIIRQRSATAFNKNLDLLTRYLRVVLEPIAYAIYWGHRGLWKARHNFYAADGVHLNSKGEHKLYRSFRGAVLKSMQLLSSFDIQ